VRNLNLILHLRYWPVAAAINLIIRDFVVPGCLPKNPVWF
jgi:hypothetical protein